MKGHGSRLARGWILPASLVALVAVHLVAAYQITTRLAVSAAVVAGIVAPILIKHLGVLGSLRAWYRHRRGSEPRP